MNKIKLRLLVLFLEIKRRVIVFKSGKYDPYPNSLSSIKLSPSETHLEKYKNAPLKLAWDNNKNIPPILWQKLAREKLAELMGYKKNEYQLSEHYIETKYIKKSGLIRKKYYIKVSANSYVPVNIIWKQKEENKNLPVMICLQGHTSGAHLSWGDCITPNDPIRLMKNVDYAIQAVNNGYVAICIEQTCFGERQEKKIHHRWQHTCVDATNRLFLLGETVLADRIKDVSSIIDWLTAAKIEFPKMNNKIIHAMGNSAGGETALYACVFDERISAIITAGCIGRFMETSGIRLTCPDTVIPGILNWLEYEDILALCAPRVLVGLSGDKDHLYPYEKMEVCINKAKEFYKKLDAEEKIIAIKGVGGHKFYPENVWPAFIEMNNRNL